MANDLDMSRIEFLELAGRHQIPTIQITAAELEEEVRSSEWAAGSGSVSRQWLRSYAGTSDIDSLA